MRQDAFAYERKLEALTRDIKTWKEKHKNELEEKDFFHKQALDAKRKNKLLKVAIGRLQVDKEKEHAMIESAPQEKEKDTDTFLTGANIDDDDKIDSIENSQALVEQNLMANAALSRRRGVNQSLQQKSQASKQQIHNRTKSQGHGTESRYKNIPSENIKF